MSKSVERRLEVQRDSRMTNYEIVLKARLDEAQELIAELEEMVAKYSEWYGDMCETCDGEGALLEEVYSEHSADSAYDCPDCNGDGFVIRPPVKASHISDGGADGD